MNERFPQVKWLVTAIISEPRAAHVTVLTEHEFTGEHDATEENADAITVDVLAGDLTHVKVESVIGENGERELLGAIMLADGEIADHTMDDVVSSIIGVVEEHTDY